MEFLIRRTEYSWYLTLIVPAFAAYYGGTFVFNNFIKGKVLHSRDHNNNHQNPKNLTPTHSTTLFLRVPRHSTSFCSLRVNIPHLSSKSHRTPTHLSLEFVF